MQRYKGLGEMNAEQLWETTLNPMTRKIKKVEMEDSISADALTSTLMGNDVPSRRSFIVEKAKEADIDI